MSQRLNFVIKSKLLLSYSCAYPLSRLLQVIARQMSSLLLDGFDDDVINEIQGSSITYRIAVGSQRGKKVFTLKTLPARDDDMDEISGQTLAKAAGFSLHAGVSAKSHQRQGRTALPLHCKTRCIHTPVRAIARWHPQLRIEDAL